MISSPLSSPPRTPPATYTPNISAHDLTRAESELFHGVDDPSDSPGFPDSAGAWAGSGEREVEIGATQTERERMLAFMGHADAKFEVLRNTLRVLTDQVNELMSFHRAQHGGRR